MLHLHQILQSTYRLYNKNSKDHHYTTDSNEKNTLVGIGWSDEGIGWYSDDSKTIPLYRVYNPNTKAAGSHHYTADQNERNSLVSRGWKNEGVAWYATKEEQLIPIQTDSTPGIQQEVLKRAASDYFIDPANADTHFGLRLSDDGSFLAEERFYYAEFPNLQGYYDCRYTGILDNVLQVSDHVYSAIVKNIQSSNTPFFDEYKESDTFKMRYNFNPHFLANDKKVYIFTPEATATEVTTYVENVSLTYYTLDRAKDNNKSHSWLLYTQQGEELLEEDPNGNPLLKKGKISEEEARQIALKYWGKAVNPPEQVVWNAWDNPQISKYGEEYYLFYLRAKIDNLDGTSHYSTQDWVYVNAYTGDCIFMGFNEF